MTTATDKYARVADLTDRVEAEMKRIGLWCDVPPRPEMTSFDMPCAVDTMAYHQWVQFVLLPCVRDVVQSRGSFPRASQVGILAIREWDGNNRATKLASLLCEFDQLIERG